MCFIVPMGPRCFVDNDIVVVDMAVDDDLQLKYTTILLKVLSDPDERDARKIVKCISKGTLLDKEIQA